MTIVVPVTGTAACGKTTLIEEMRDVISPIGLASKNKVYVIDSSKDAKDFLSKYALCSQRLAYASATKNDSYRESLVDIIKALDRFDIRVECLVNEVLKIVNENLNANCKGVTVIFINIREISNIKKIADKLSNISDNDIKCVTMICRRKDQLKVADNEVDKADFVKEADEAGILYINAIIPEVTGFGGNEVDANKLNAYREMAKDMVKSIYDEVSLQHSHIYLKEPICADN